MKVSRKATIKAPKVLLAENANTSMVDIDKEILIDLEYSEEESAETIMKEILDQAVEEMWIDYEGGLEQKESFEDWYECSGKRGRWSTPGD